MTTSTIATDKAIPIVELFGPTIQGEGMLSGTLSHFVRTGGCGLRCVWCDSMDAVLPDRVKRLATKMTPGQIFDKVEALPYAPWVTFTGGDPCMWRGLGSIIPRLNMVDYRVAVETQGEMFPEWLDQVDLATFSPKGPSSGNIVDVEPLYEWLVTKRRETKVQVCIKIVIFTEEDLSYALDVYGRIPYYLYDGFYFTAGTPPYVDGTTESAVHRTMDVVTSMRNVAGAVLARAGRIPFNDKVHVGCQQHVLLWPHAEKGV